LQRAGRTAEAYDKVRGLPEPIRNHRVMMNISVQLASLLSEQLYREELGRLARYHRDDPTAAFTLIDYYFYKGDTDAAMNAILGMERAFGNDGAISILKANISVEAGDLFGARRFAREGVELEPDNELGQLTLLSILMLSEQYTDGIKVLEGLEQDFGYVFDASSFAGEELYEGFVRSAEYDAWIAKR
jgi:predicted Zn-dependent protease